MILAALSSQTSESRPDGTGALFLTSNIMQMQLFEKRFLHFNLCAPMTDGCFLDLKFKVRRLQMTFIAIVTCVATVISSVIAVLEYLRKR